MKKIKSSKLVCVFLAVLMIFSTCIPVFAAPIQKGSITIKGVTQGEVYTFYKLLDLTYSRDDDATNYAYSVNSDFDGFFAGLGLTGYDATDGKITSAESRLVYDYISAQTSPEQIASFATKVAKYAQDNSIVSNPAAVTASSNDDIVINDVDAGYYVMVPKSTNTDVLTSALFAISTLTDSVELSNKSVYPTLQKKIVEGDREIERNDAAYGDVVTYRLKSNVPSSMNGYDEYIFTVTDTLDEDMIFQNDVAITVGNKTLVKDTDFTVTAVDDVITIDFNDFIDYNTDEFRGKDIIITYTAKVGSTADLGSVGNTSTAYLTFSNDPTDTASTERTKDVFVATYVAGIQFTKVNARSKALADAVFEISGWEAGVTPKLNMTVKATDVVNAVDKLTVTTDSTGLVTVYGLKEGTYVITEIDAPNGYVKLDNPIKINISFDEMTGAFSVSLVDEDEHVDGLVLENTGDSNGVAVFNIINKTMSILPNTGSTTTIICVSAGVVCLVVAGVIIAMSRKKKADAAE